MSKATITCAPNGPLILKGETKVQDSSGNPVQYSGQAALCRCGESANKPFCDGAHSAKGFTDKNESDATKNKKRDYKGDVLTVHYNKELCSHAAQCVAGSPEVFDPKAKPWILPNKAKSKDSLIQTVRNCPSGALTYSENDQETIDFGQTECEVSIAKNGPYYIKGGIDVASKESGQGASKEHYALCRCGKSRNKPYCDGVHHDIGFQAD